MGVDFGWRAGGGKKEKTQHAFDVETQYEKCYHLAWKGNAAPFSMCLLYFALMMGILA